MQPQQHVKSKMATLEKLQQMIKQQEEKARKRKAQASVDSAVTEAKNKLSELKYGPTKARGKRLRALSNRFGKGILKTGEKVGKKIGPKIVKQAKLIREQQLRDDAIDRARGRKSSITKKPKRRTSKKSKGRIKTRGKVKARRKTSGRSKNKTIQIVIKR